MIEENYLATVAALTQNFNVVSQKEIENIINAGLDEYGDSGFHGFYYWLGQKNKSIHNEDTIEYIFYVAGFIKDDFPRLWRSAQRWYSSRNDQCLAKSLISNNGGAVGIELQNATADQFALICGDASTIGRYRASFYDESGFYCHEVFDSPEEALGHAIRIGFREQTKTNKLDILATSKAWARGMELAFVLQKGLDPFKHDWQAWESAFDTSASC